MRAHTHEVSIGLIASAAGCTDRGRRSVETGAEMKNITEISERVVPAGLTRLSDSTQ